MDLLAYLLFRAALGILNMLPLEGRLSLLAGGLRLIGRLRPKYLKIARKNLELAFPAQADLHGQIIEKSYRELARLVVDVARLHRLDAEWVKQHIDFSDYTRLIAPSRGSRTCGILFATGHLGSFELLAHAVPFFGRPFRFVARRFKLARIDRWWLRTREASGNRVIRRDGAFREIVKTLREGTEVGILFDQNVRREHAVFVPWFGKPAATTKSLGHAALTTKAPVVAAYLRYIGDDRYRIVLQPVELDDIYQGAHLSKEERVLRITQRVTAAFEQMIRDYPEGWFWMHRRWRTAPVGQREDFYS